MEAPDRNLALDLIHDPAELLDGHLLAAVEILPLQQRVALWFGVNAGVTVEVAERRYVHLEDDRPGSDAAGFAQCVH